MTSFSSSTIPLGLGLSAAAHFHLCNKSLAQAERERLQRIEFSERCQIDMFVHSLSEKPLLSELISLLEQTLHINCQTEELLSPFSCDYHHNNQQGYDQTRTRTRTRTRNAAHQRSLPAGTMSPRINHKPPANRTVASAAMMDQESNGEDEEERNNSQGLTARCSPRVISTTIYEHPNITLEQVELWIKACKELRSTLEKRLRKTLPRMSIRTRSDGSPPFWTLKLNIVSSLLLGAISMVHQLSSTSLWARIFTNRQPTGSSYYGTMALLATNLWKSSNNNSAETTSSSSLADTPIATPAAFQFLPIAPTLFFSGIHFFVALRTQWTLYNIDQQSRSQRIFARRMKMLCTTLLLREQRLTFLLYRIEAQENNGNASSLAPTPTDSDMSILPPFRWESVSRSSSLPLWRRPRATTCRDSNMIRFFSSRSCEVDDTIMACTPDLEQLSTERFLHDPVERSNIFRTELEALRQELIVFRAESLQQ